MSTKLFWYGAFAAIAFWFIARFLELPEPLETTSRYIVWIFAFLVIFGPFLVVLLAPRWVEKVARRSITEGDD